MTSSKLVSIITVAFNSEKTIKDTIKSINNQTYNNIEHILIDGNSNDKTLQFYNSIIKLRNFTVLSEPDEGIYDAMNKGVNISTGDIVFILNSDDIFYDNNVVENFVEIFQNQPEVDIVYGSIQISSNENIKKIKRVWIPTSFKPNSFKKAWHPPHPGLVVKKECYEKYGNFNKSFKIAADFELMLRFFEIHRLKSLRTESIVTIQRGGGASMKFSGVIKGLNEIYYSFKNNNIKIFFLGYIFMRYKQKIIQILKS